MMTRRTYSDDEIQKMARGSGSLSDTSETLVIEPWRKYVANVLTSNRTKTFDSSNISQGQRISFFNADAAQDLILQDDSSSDVYTLGPGMHVELEALVDAPTDGADWAKVAGSTIIEVLDTTGNWDPPAFVHRVWAEVFGGGAGGNGGTDATSALAFGGAGGGSGTVLEDFVSVVPGTPVAYVIGAGGSGGSASGGSGGVGGDSAFGILTAPGGLVGLTESGLAAPSTPPGSGAIAIHGSPGQSTGNNFTTIKMYGGTGGSNKRGAGGASVLGATAGVGNVFGGGGGGGAAVSTGTADHESGGAGVNGRVLLRY